jgi:hypothetical protein
MTRTRTLAAKSAVTLAVLASGTGLLYMASGMLPPTTAYATPAVSATPTPTDGRPSDDGIWPPVDTYDQALAQCAELSASESAEADCAESAAQAWPDAAAAAEQAAQDDAMAQEQEQIDADMAELEGPFPGDPGFDCRIHAEEVCYVTINGDEYAIGFHDGSADIAWDIIPD